MELEYMQVGDYRIPNLKADEEPEEALTKYGRMHLNFLKEERSGIYTGMLLDGTLKEHCLKIQKAAEERMDRLISMMAKEQGVNEALKAAYQMRWVRMMNNIRNSAEETVLTELIYS
ncbi:MAG: TnpV protein [Lachnospiraceae bacterium]|nr:TnpV protein [Lachnospiraceae bacterium]